MILPPTIETERLTLRAPRLTDFDAYAVTMMSDRADDMGGPFEMGETYDIFCVEVAGWVLRGYGSLAIEDRESKTFAGMIVLQQLPHYPEREIGWAVQEEFEGRGVAHEAAVAARHYAFETLGWVTVVSYMYDTNKRSIALAERLGAVSDETAAKPSDDADVLVMRHPSVKALAA